MSSSDSVFTYTPSFALALVATILYLIPTLILTWQTIFKYRSWFFLCVLLGGAWAFMHSTLQTWATSVSPTARAQVVPLFSACLFLGGSSGAALGGPLAGAGHYGPLFAVSAAVFVPLTVVSAATRRIYLRTRRGR